MNQKTVYILGAGASKHAGLPLLNDFFAHAYSVREKNRWGQNAPNGYAVALQQVDDFRATLKVEKPTVNVHNLEEIYAEALERKVDSLVPSLNKVIEGVMDLGGCVIRYQGQQYQPDSVYDDFVKRFIRAGDVTTITFNWDCLLDYALFYNDLAPNYCLGQGQERNPVKLIKIHGSINWGQCKKCNSGPYPTTPNNEIGTRPGVIRRAKADFDLRLASEIIPKKTCPKCNDRLASLIVPPSQEAKFSFLQHYETEVNAVIKEAERLYFIGYSFPESDRYFLHLMQKSLVGNIRLREIHVVNPDSGLKSTYEENLEAKRHSLTVKMIPKTFAQYLASGIH